MGSWCRGAEVLPGAEGAADRDGHPKTGQVGQSDRSAVQVNMLEAKNQLSRLVKAALAGEEVIIASHGQPRVRLVPCSESPGLRHCGALSGGIKEKERSLIEAAFSAEADQAAQQLMEG